MVWPPIAVAVMITAIVFICLTIWAMQPTLASARGKIEALETRNTIATAECAEKQYELTQLEQRFQNAIEQRNGLAKESAERLERIQHLENNRVPKIDYLAMSQNCEEMAKEAADAVRKIEHLEAVNARLEQRLKEKDAPNPKVHRARNSGEVRKMFEQKTQREAAKGDDNA